MQFGLCVPSGSARGGAGQSAVSGLAGWLYSATETVTVCYFELTLLEQPLQLCAVLNTAHGTVLARKDDEKEENEDARKWART